MQIAKIRLPLGEQSSHQAAYLALLAGLEEALSFGFHSIRVKISNRLVYKQVSKYSSVISIQICAV